MPCRRHVAHNEDVVALPPRWRVAKLAGGAWQILDGRPAREVISRELTGRAAPRQLIKRNINRREIAAGVFSRRRYIYLR